MGSASGPAHSAASADSAAARSGPRRHAARRSHALAASRGWPCAAQARARPCERCGLLGNERERAHEELPSLLGLAQLAEPDFGGLDQQLRALLAAHRHGDLELGELEHHVPLRARGVDAAQLAQRGPLLGAGSERVAKTTCRRVEVVAPLGPDLAEAEVHACSLLRVLGDVRRREPLLVQRHEIVPTPRDEPLLLERGEGAGIPRIREEALAVALEHRRHPDLTSSSGGGGVPPIHRPEGC